MRRPTIGPASTSASTAAAALASRIFPLPCRRAATTPPAAWSAARSATTGRWARPYSASKATSTGPAFAAAHRAPARSAKPVTIGWAPRARRLGYAFNRFLPFVTGGAAFGNIKTNVAGVGSADDTRAGWTLGGGVEAAIAGPWTAKVEYLYADLGRGTSVLGADAGFKTKPRARRHQLPLLIAAARRAKSKAPGFAPGFFISAGHAAILVCAKAGTWPANLSSQATRFGWSVRQLPPNRKSR